jgi:multiple sugar transport system permease protein
MKQLFDRHTTFFLMLPYIVLFLLFIVIPIVGAAGLSFTYFNTIEIPKFIGVKNYLSLLTNDTVFMRNVLPNTIIYALFVGFGGYALAFFLAWSLSQLTRLPRTILTIIIYLPSMTGGILLSTVWGVMFNGEKSGWLNYILLKLQVINEPVLWLQSSGSLLIIMIIVALWSSMGVGFLAILSGLLNVNSELYEAGYIDGIKNRFQEIIYITIPSVKPQMLFGAIMAIVATFNSAGVGVELSGANPTPNYAGQLIVNHIDDFGFLRNEMGYAAAVSVIVLIGVRLLSRGAEKIFKSDD